MHRCGAAPALRDLGAEAGGADRPDDQRVRLVLVELMVSSHGAEMNDVVGGDIKQQVLNRIRLWCDLTLGVGFGC